MWKPAIAALLFLAIKAPGVVFAVEPDEVLADPALEMRARAISADLRCVVCQSENIDDSNAPLAKDLRLLVRERLMAGDTDQQVIDYMVSRYGDYVLLKPPVQNNTLFLWGAPAMFALLGGGICLWILFRRSPVVAPQALSTDEETKIDEMLR